MRWMPIVLLLLPCNAFALVTINNSTPFPYNATTAGETYRLSENITCPNTCIVLSGAADNATIDLNGFTMTYGTSNAVTVPNSEFENWTGNVPDNWAILSGAVSPTAAIDWGTYDLYSSGAFSMRSDAFTLNSGQTYHAWAFVKSSSSSASGTLKIVDAGTNAVLASQTLDGTNMSRGFTQTGGEANALLYKPSVNTSVKLELELVGAYTYRVAEVTVGPHNHYGIANWGYQNITYFPDISGMTWGEAENVTVQNGTINQGSGNATYSSAVYNGQSTWVYDGLTLNVAGPNSGGIFNYKTITDSTISFTNTRVFNRMYGSRASGAHKESGYTATLLIDNVTFNNFPQYGTTTFNCPTTYENGGSITVINSRFYNRGVVTEPYAMVFSGAKGLSIHDNIINPGGNVGRGILVDAVGCSDPQIEGANGRIYNNQFLNIYEDENFEYPVTSLESAGIRVRNWGGQYEGHHLEIDNNVFTYTNPSGGSHATYGINVNATSVNDDLSIHNNTITVNNHTTNDTNWATGIALQMAGNAGAARHDIYNNTITSNSYGIAFDGNDGANSTNIDVYSNLIDAAISPIRFGQGAYTGTDSDIDFWCNDLESTTAGGQPIYLNGTLSDLKFDYNLLTSATIYEVWADANESTDVLFFGSGTIDVTGGGSVGAAGAATNGSAGCWTTAGSGYTPPDPTCSDGIQNGTETGIDCGGSCDPCTPATSGEFIFAGSMQ